MIPKGRKRNRRIPKAWVKQLDFLGKRGRLPLVLRGRRFTYRGLRTIMQCVADHYDAGRTRISEVVCARLSWRQPNGWLKDRACRDVLRLLEEMRLLELPPRLVKSAKRDLGAGHSGRSEPMPCPIVPVRVMPEKIALELAKGSPAEHLWNALVQNYHYLGHRVQVGRCLKYVVRGDGQLIGAISFSSPAWQLAPRDKLLRQVGITRPAAMDLVINNSRFCILPQVRVPHLASRILSHATRRIVTDWAAFYSIKPLIAETFVEPELFCGTCYRAANWHKIGATSGYAKVGRSHHNSQQPKMIFVYGLTRHWRRKLATAIADLRLGGDFE